METTYEIHKDNKVVTFQKKFQVLAISDNTNSFGLYGVVLVARDGEAWRLGMSYLYVPKLGDEISATVRIKIGNKNQVAFNCSHEIPEQLPDCPEEICSKMFNKIAA